MKNIELQLTDLLDLQSRDRIFGQVPIDDAEICRVKDRLELYWGRTLQLLQLLAQ